MKEATRRYVLLGSLATATIPFGAIAASRRLCDLVITALRWSQDGGATWHNGAVLEGAEVWFEATVRNNGRVAASPLQVIRVDFRVNGSLVAWSDTHRAGLAVNASVALRANNGPDDVKLWTAATPGNYAVSGIVDRANTVPEQSNSNNTFASSITVESETLPPSNTFYVATTGNDSNPGTQAQPWRNITPL